MLGFSILSLFNLIHHTSSVGVISTCKNNDMCPWTDFAPDLLPTLNNESEHKNLEQYGCLVNFIDLGKGKLDREGTKKPLVIW